MTAQRLAASSFVLAVVVVAAVATSTSSAHAIMIAVLGALAVAVGVGAGAPIVVMLGGATLVGAASLVVGRGDQYGGVMVVLVAPAVWCSVETGLRSIELRPAVHMSARAQAMWLSSTAAVALGTIALGLVLDGVVDAVPAGGLTFRVLSVVAVLVAGVVVAVANLSWTRRAGDPARGQGSGAPRARNEPGRPQ